MNVVHETIDQRIRSHAGADIRSDIRSAHTKLRSLWQF